MTDEEIRQILIKRKRQQRARQRRKRIIAFVLAAAVGLSLAYVLGNTLGNRKYDSEIKGIVSVTEDMPIINAAVPEIGNEGGEPYWKWFGFDSRVEWCAIFTSWCAQQCGYIESGQAPSFALVSDGSDWFKMRDQWLEPSSTPEPGDLIFFDWEQDDARDHVGIVTAVVGDKVFTIEGNSSDRCRRKRYSLDDPVIYGYGQIKE